MTRAFSIVECEQKSAEWFAARAGRLTSSEAHVIYMQGRTKGSESTTKRDLRIRLALERLNGRSLDDGGYASKDMQRGLDTERSARLAYEAATGTILDTTGFLSHNTLMVGASLDSHIDDFVGVAEFKCPKSATHLDYIRAKDAAVVVDDLARAVPTDYLHQITHQLFVTGAAWADFVSFDDRMPEPGQLLIIRVTRDMVDVGAHELAARLFLSDVEKEIASIAKLIGWAVAA
jgi:hypothetical protein